MGKFPDSNVTQRKNALGEESSESLCVVSNFFRLSSILGDTTSFTQQRWSSGKARGP